ncbi:FHA domain-containing protein [Curtobacterium sp. MCBA15_001]|uniref:FHA domain-containing protein n=1 Tax=Curtobacterium sp. MCBA15_001 TaxID=1898731 RepID=UPI0008DD71D1|nr:FHA domain-containing protein [Curtobacterium sp. MCBA15_001]OIH93491.1 hypothetical protein BIU90_07320 [Curtobacterium sp. MCBA15_001]
MHEDDDRTDRAAATDDTVLRARSRRSAGQAGVDPQPDPGVELDLDADLDDTVVRAAVPRNADPFGDTVVRLGVAAPTPTAHRPAAVPEQPPGLPSGLPPVPQQPRERVPSIRIGDRVLRLDRPVVIGRRPALPRIVRGPEPQLLTVPSPLGQVSSSHLLVHAEGEAAVVDDLRSTNGTVVRPAGAPPYRMPAGASIVALTGTVVEIGDGVAIEVLSPHLRVAPPADGFPSPLAPPTTQLTGTPRTPRERS